MGEPGLSVEYLLLNHDYICLPLSHHNAASSHLQTQFCICFPSPLHLLGSFNTLAYHVCLLFTRKLLLPLGSPSVTTCSSDPMGHRALPAHCLVSPKKTILLSHLIPAFKAAQKVQLSQLTPQVHLTYSAV